MHDGENLFNASTSFGGVAWQCQDAANSLILGEKIEEFIIFGIDNTAHRIPEYTYSRDPQYGGGEGDEYLDFLEKTVLPRLNGLYRVDGRRPGILGSSLGGLISCYAGYVV